MTSEYQEQQGVSVVGRQGSMVEAQGAHAVSGRKPVLVCTRSWPRATDV